MAAFRNLGDLIDPAADKRKAALIDLSGASPRTFSYHALDALADSCARGLLRQGLRRGERVGILAANSAEFLAICFGAQRAGLVPVPVNWRFPPATVEYVLRDAGAVLVFADAARAMAVPSGLPSLVIGGPEWVAFLDPGPFEAVVPAPDEPALFLYTSGSTGRPKGVVLSHRAHLWVVEQRMAAANMSAERVLIAAPLYHMNGLALAQLACASHATVILLPLFEAAPYLRAIDAHRPTWLTGVPPMMAMLLRERALLDATDTASVRNIRLGSAPVSAGLRLLDPDLLTGDVLRDAYMALHAAKESGRDQLTLFDAALSEERLAAGRTVERLRGWGHQLETVTPDAFFTMKPVPS